MTGIVGRIPEKSKTMICIFLIDKIYLLVFAMPQHTYSPRSCTLRPAPSGALLGVLHINSGERLRSDP